MRAKGVFAPQGASGAISARQELRQDVLCTLSIGVLLLAVIFYSGCMTLSVEKLCGLAACIAIIAMALFSHKRMGSVIGFLLAALTAYIVLAMVSTQYAYSGKFALSETTKLLVGYAVFLAAVLYLPRERKWLAMGLYAVAGVTAVIGLLSVDAASGGTLSAPVFKLFSNYTTYYNAEDAAFTGSRIGSFLTNSNIYGELMSLGVIASFFLGARAKKWYARLGCAVLIAVNLYADILAMSLVALFMCVLGCLAMLFTMPRGEKLGVLFLMGEAAVVTLLTLLLSYAALGTQSALPLLCCILGGGLLFALDSILRMPLQKKLAEVKLRTVVICTAAIALLAAAAAAIVLGATAGVTIVPEQIVARQVSLAPGEYTLTVEAERPAELAVRVYSYDDPITTIANKETLCDAAAEKVTFTVPENSHYCEIIFSLAAGAQAQAVDSVSYAGASDGEIVLSYKYLPEFITARLQSLASMNTLHLRVYLFDAALALFAQRPIFGIGAGGYQNSICSVQEMFLETKYVHNHYLQMLCELGAVGFLIFLAIAAFFLRLIVKARKNEERAADAPVFLGLFVAMFGGALSDVSWSSGNYIPAAYFILALAAVYLGDAEHTAIPSGKWQRWVPFGAAAVFAVFAVALCLNRAASSNVQKYMTFASMETSARMDAFEKNDYLYSYVLNAPNAGDDAVLERAMEYAQRLSTVPSNTMGKGLASFYFTYGMVDEAFACYNSFVDRNRSDESKWQECFDDLRTRFDISSGSNMAGAALLPEAVDDIAALAEKFEAVGSEQRDKLTLDEPTVMWLSIVRRAAAEGVADAQELLELFSSTLYDSRYAGDFDEDGLSDPVSKGINKEGEEYLHARVYCGEAGEYMFRWYDASGEMLSETKVELTAPESRDTSILSGNAGEPYLVVTRG